MYLNFKQYFFVHKILNFFNLQQLTEILIREMELSSFMAIGKG